MADGSTAVSTANLKGNDRNMTFSVKEFKAASTDNLPVNAIFKPVETLSLKKGIVVPPRC